jgi:hypothetical protein
MISDDLISADRWLKGLGPHVTIIGVWTEKIRKFSRRLLWLVAVPEGGGNY